MFFGTRFCEHDLNPQKASFHYSILESFREMMIDCTHDFIHLLKSSDESTHDFLGKTDLNIIAVIYQHTSNYFVRFIQQSEFEDHLQDSNGCRY